MDEKAFQSAVVRLARQFGWRVYFTWSSMHSPAGYPDLTMCRPASNGQPGRLIFAELKTDRGKLTPAQEEWLADLRAVGAEAHCWRPSDVDTIAEVLR